MMANLFPTFAVPKVVENNIKEENRTKHSIYFDCEKGDIALDSNGEIKTATPYDSWVQWCLKTVLTQRWSFFAYSSQTGVEIEQALAQQDRKAQQSYIEKTVTEALLADPYQRTKRVYDFSFVWKTDGVEVTFWINGLWYDDKQLTAFLVR